MTTRNPHTQPILNIAPQSIGVAKGTNDTGAGGVASSPKQSTNVQADKIWTLSIPAGTPSNPSTIPIIQTASKFFVITASATINIRTSNGLFNPFTSYQGLKLANNFSQLEIQNTNNFPVAVQIFVGTSDFESYLIALQQSNLPTRVYNTSPTPNSSALIAIPDKSGQAIMDAQGVSRIAVQRVAILIGNVDGSTTVYLQPGLTGSTNASGVPIFPQQLINISAAGNFFITINNSTNLNVSVTELYLTTT